MGEYAVMDWPIICAGMGVSGFLVTMYSRRGDWFLRANVDVDAVANAVWSGTTSTIKSYQIWSELRLIYNSALTLPPPLLPLLLLPLSFFKL